jgi:serine/threonine-protein kinase RsbW
MDKKHIQIKNNIDELHALNAFLEEVSDQWELPMKVAMNINLTLEEIITNIIFYGYQEDKDKSIDINLYRTALGVDISVIDNARPFNMLLKKDYEDAAKSAEDREIGGLGIHFVKTLMDEVSYERTNDQNVLRLFKRIENK